MRLSRKSGLGDAPSAPMDEHRSAGSCLGLVACRPCRRSRRARMARCVLLCVSVGVYAGKMSEGVRVPFVFLVVHPSCAEWKLLLHVLKVLVAEAINADQGTGFGITYVLPKMLDDHPITILLPMPSSIPPQSCCSRVKSLWRLSSRTCIW